MGLEERGLNTTIVSLTYGFEGLLNMIPALQEIRLDQVLNEDKNKLEQGSYRPDLVARHLHSNQAAVIGCNQDYIDKIRQSLTLRGVPFITVLSKDFPEESKRPNFFYSVIIRDIDGTRVTELLQDLLKEHEKEEPQEELEEEFEEELERVGEEQSTYPAEEASPAEPSDPLPEEAEEDYEEDSTALDEENKKKGKSKKTVSREKERKKREENRRQEEKRSRDRKQEDDKRREESTRLQEDARRRAQAKAASAAALKAAAVYGVSSTAGEALAPNGYQDAYAIRAEEIEEQCERYAKRELLRRELEQRRLLGKQDEEYKRIQKEYQEVENRIQAKHDRFQSIGQSGWREYSSEVIERTKNATTEELKENKWGKPANEDYLRKTEDGFYCSYTQEEKRAYLDSTYKNGFMNVSLHSYTENSVSLVSLKKKDELINAREHSSTEDGNSHYEALLSKYGVRDQDVSQYKKAEIERELAQTEESLKKTEDYLELQGYSGYETYRKETEAAAEKRTFAELETEKLKIAPDPRSTIKGPDGSSCLDFRDNKYSRHSYDSLYTETAGSSPSVSFAGHRPDSKGTGTFKLIGTGNPVVSMMKLVQGTQNTTSGGILMGAGNGVRILPPDMYSHRGSSIQAQEAAYKNNVYSVTRSDSPRARSGFIPHNEHTQTFSKMLIDQMDWQSDRKNMVIHRNLQGVIRDENTVSIAKAPIKETSIKSQSTNLKRLEITSARACHAMVDAMANRYFLMAVKQGYRVAVQTSIGETEAGRTCMTVADAARVPAHLVKQQILQSGRKALDQSDAAMTALNNHILKAKVANAATLDGKALEEFALNAGMKVEEFRKIQNDPVELERIIRHQFTGTFGTPDKSDMQRVIDALGIRGSLEKDGTIGSQDILQFLSHKDETTLSERTRVLVKAEENLLELNESQRKLVQSLFRQSGSMEPADLRMLLIKNGISEEAAENFASKLAGKNWASNEDLVAILRQGKIQEDTIQMLMGNLGGIMNEDRAAMIGLYQIYAGDSLTGFDMDKFRDLANVLNIDQSLKDELNLNYIHLSQMSISDIKRLLKQYKGDGEAEVFLERLLNEKIGLTVGRNEQFARFELWNGVQSLIYRMAHGTDAMNGFNQVMSITRAFTRVTRSGYRLVYHFVFRRLTNPVSIGKLRVTPANLTASRAKEAAKAAIKQNKIAAKFSKIITRRVPNAGRFLSNAMHPGRYIGRTIGRKVEWILIKKGINTAAIKTAAKAISAKITSFSAAASAILIKLALILIIIIAILMMYESIEKEDADKSYSAAYVSAADGKEAFAQEIIDMLRGYTDDFINEINNAQYNRGMYSGMAGYNTNEDVTAFESGAYQVVFRGPDGEPIDDIQSVDLNNSKDIISMASVFIPTVFQKPGDNASAQSVEEYERDKEHFNDYCTFLWAASHQISIEEYHPGNSTNEDVIDESGLVTDATTGKCEMDYKLFGDKGAGVNWWLATGISKSNGNICSICDRKLNGKGWADEDIQEHTCIAKPAADPCTHGHWECIADTKYIHTACPGHHRKDDDYVCSDKGRYPYCKSETTYKRVWVCDGHMGAVVYVTIGKISRLPNYGEATDYNFENPENYGGTGIFSYFGGSSGVGSSAFTGEGYELTDAQLKYLCAMCIAEQGACANTEVTMRYQASLMANVYELYGKRKGLSLYEYITLLPTQSKNGVKGWFATSTHERADATYSSISGSCVEWARDVFCNGNRITQANEQGTLNYNPSNVKGGFTKVYYNGKTYTGLDMKNESIYVSGETILYTSAGQACLFEAFPGGHPNGCGTPVVDPFCRIIN